MVMRDNLSSMKQETHGKASSGKRRRLFDIEYFNMKDLIERKELTIQYCPTNETTANP